MSGASSIPSGDPTLESVSIQNCGERGKILVHFGPRLNNKASVYVARKVPKYG